MKRSRVALGTQADERSCNCEAPSFIANVFSPYFMPRNRFGSVCYAELGTSQNHLAAISNATRI
jgi:hypothetical protein